MSHALSDGPAEAPAAPEKPDFRHVETWIFDLDNTLYSAEADVFPQIESRMNHFVRRRFGVDESEANRIRKSYFRDFGTTLSGLMKKNRIDPEDFLTFVHDIDLTGLAPDPQLDTALARLPGRRFVFTNGCAHHAARVLDRLGLTHRFEQVWDIRTIRFNPKPALDAYRAVVAQAAFAPARSAMFEDTKRNLVPAHALGMTTVWLRTALARTAHGPETPHVAPHHVHYEIDNLSDFLHTIEVTTTP